MGIWLDKEDAGGVQGSTNIVESDGWKSSFATNMKHVETIYSELPSLNVIRATALVGAMRKTAQDSGGDPKALADALRSEWTVLSGTNKKYVYGEISLVTLAEALNRYCSAPQLRTFVDLGSGSGRAVLSVAINNPQFEKLTGIELLPGLHEIAGRAQETYRLQVQSCLEQHTRQTLKFQCADFLHCDWSDADVVLAVSTCFPVELMARIEDKAATCLKPGSICITLTKEFKGPMWQLLGCCKRMHGWGHAWLYVYRLLHTSPRGDKSGMHAQAGT